MKRAAPFMIIILMQMAEPAEAARPANEAQEPVQIARTSNPEAEARRLGELVVEPAAIERRSGRRLLLPIYVPPSRSAPPVRAGMGTRGR